MKPKKTKITKEEMNRLIKNHNQLIKKDLESRKQEKIAPEGYLISLIDVNKVYPNHVQAVNDFSINIKENEFIVFVGPSGCGKSTTLRMIAGLEDITCGDLYLYGQYANDLLPSERDAAMVFQSYALYPNMTVFDNLAFSLRVKHTPKAEIYEKVNNAAKILEIEDYLDRKPSALSGGQRQRVALGRAIVRNAKVFLMDEPLSNLDAKLRISMRSEIVKLHKKIGATTIYVTHDQTEAMTMADRIVVMNKGFIQQIGTPKEIFMKPNNLFVATFVGSPTMNILKATSENNELLFENGFKMPINKQIALSINQSYEEEKNNILKNIEILEKDVEERKVLLSKPALMKARQKYYSKKIKINNDLLVLNKNLEFEKNKENINLENVKSIESLIEKNKTLLDDLERKQQNIEQDTTIPVIEGDRYQKALKNDAELNIIIQDLDKQKELLAKNGELQGENGTELLFGIRPENIIASQDKMENSFETEVDYFELLGNVSNIHFYIGKQKVIASLNSKIELSVGDKIYVQFDEERMHLFNALNENIIRQA